MLAAPFGGLELTMIGCVADGVMPSVPDAPNGIGELINATDKSRRCSSGSTIARINLAASPFKLRFNIISYLRNHSELAPTARNTIGEGVAVGQPLKVRNRR